MMMTEGFKGGRGGGEGEVGALGMDGSLMELD
jgi:hypothetical protein